jgi:hypothetical protein
VNVGPALQDVDLGTVVITVANSDLVLSGKVVDCSSNPVDSGMVDIQVDGLDYRAAVNKGSFTMPISRCYSTTVPVKLTATDYTAQQTGSATSLNASNGQVDAGQLSACGITYTQFITITVNNNTYNWTTPPNTIGAGPSGFIASASSNNFVQLQGSNITSVGQYQLIPYLFVPNGNWGYSTPLQLNITAYGAVGGYITGTLSGNIQDSVTKQSYPLTGSLKVLRTQ